MGAVSLCLLTFVLFRLSPPFLSFATFPQEGNGNDGAERAKKRIRILEAEIERAYEQFGTGEH